MNISQRFLLLFCGVVLCSCLLTGGFAVHSLRQAYILFTHATRPELIPLMAGKMYQKAVVGFCVASFFSIAIALPVGVYLLRQASKPYLYIFENLSDIAQKRLLLNDEKNLSESVISSIQRFLELWRFDYEKLRDYEKEKEWKNGARMLLHELKNPLTPLKLSLQKMQIHCSGYRQEELSTIVKSSADIENILNCFKELVNIEFGPKESFDAIGYFRELYNQSKDEGVGFIFSGLPEEGVFPVIGEKTLLKIVYSNLLRNALEANGKDFRIEMIINKKEMILEFITQGQIIENTSRIFRLGYSTKGNGHGFGLFICKKISDYLNLNLQCVNRSGSVIFSIEMRYTDAGMIASPDETKTPATTGLI